jgi:uncharacterized protein YlaI
MKEKEEETKELVPDIDDYRTCDICNRTLSKDEVGFFTPFGKITVDIYIYVCDDCYEKIEKERSKRVLPI